MDKFDLIFSGEILPGHDLAQVKTRFGHAMQIDDPKRVEAFFSGQPVTLRRSLEKEAAAHYYAKLRRIGAIPHLEKVVPEPIAPTPPVAAKKPQRKPQRPKKAAFARPPVPVPTALPPLRRKRQPGAPNMFSLRLADSARDSAPRTSVSSSVLRVPLIAAAIALVAFVLVAARFITQQQSAEATGLGPVIVDASQQPVVVLGKQLLLHDRAGIATEAIPLAQLEVSAAHPYLDFFANGDALIFGFNGAAGRSEASLLGKLISLGGGEQSAVLHCQLQQLHCEDFGPFDASTSKLKLLVNQRTSHVYVADSANNSLHKLDGQGELLVSRSTELTNTSSIRMEEGVLYIGSGDSATIRAFRPDDIDFGDLMDEIHLQPEAAVSAGHDQVVDFTLLADTWWVLLQGTASAGTGLYLFDQRWNSVGQVELPPGSAPQQLQRWGQKILLLDAHSGRILRFDAQGNPQKDFTSVSIITLLEAQQDQLSLSGILQVSTLAILLVVGAGLLIFGVLQILRGKVYRPPSDKSELGFDISSIEINWLAPAPDREQRFKLIGYVLGGVGTALLLAAFIAGVELTALLALTIMLCGCGGAYAALYYAKRCHIGALDDQLILVDHHNIYRVGSGPRIQYFNNYVMIDDVIVYLGNRLLSTFAGEQLQREIEPLVSTGIKIDRTTLRVKLIQARHPILLGLAGLSVAVMLALALMFF